MKKGKGKWVNIPVEKLVKADWNYKKDERDKQEKLVQNIKRNGQVESILVREINGGVFEVINGNHRLDAFKECGFKEVFAYNVGKMQTQAAKRLSIELNETRFKADKAALDAIVDSLADSFGMDDLSETIYGIDSLQIILHENSVKDVKRGFKYECPKCKHKWN